MSRRVEPRAEANPCERSAGTPAAIPAREPAAAAADHRERRSRISRERKWRGRATGVLLSITLGTCATAARAEVGGGARGAPGVVDDVLASLPREPSVRELQRAAAHQAEVDPARVRSWLVRIRTAALAPELRLRVGRGARLLQSTATRAGVDRYVVDDGTITSFDVSAAFRLDRLVFDREEIRLARETQRVAARREALLTDVARLYFERRRLQATLVLSPPASAADLLAARLRIDELGAILDGLTGGALSRERAPP